MNTETLIEQLEQQIDQARKTASRNLPLGDPSRDRLMVTLNEATRAARAIESTAGSGYYLNTRKALKEYEEADGQKCLFLVEIGEFDGNDNVPKDLYRVLVAGEDFHMACDAAEAFCINDLGRPEQALAHRNIDQIRPEVMPDLLSHIRSS